MKRVRITRKRAIEAMEQAVAERGEGFRFTEMFGEGIGCFYRGIPIDEIEYEEYGVAVGPEVPACLVGLAFHTIDPDLDDFLASFNEETISGIFGINKDSISEDCPKEVQAKWGDNEIVITRKALIALHAGQLCQDNNGTWGEALTLAKKAGV